MPREVDVVPDICGYFIQQAATFSSKLFFLGNQLRHRGSSEGRNVQVDLRDSSGNLTYLKNDSL